MGVPPLVVFQMLQRRSSKCSKKKIEDLLSVVAMVGFRVQAWWAAIPRDFQRGESEVKAVRASGFV